MKKIFIGIVVGLVSAYLIYAGWVFITHNPENPYGKKEMSASDIERIKSLPDSDEELSSGQDLLNKIAEGSSVARAPIEKSEAITLSEQMFMRFCHEKDIDYEAYTINGIGSSQKFMWLVQFNARENPNYWVAFDRLGRVEVLESVGKEALQSAGL